MARIHLIALGLGLLTLTGWLAPAGAQSFPTPPGTIPGANPIGPSNRFGQPYRFETQPAPQQPAAQQTAPGANPVCQRLEAQLVSIDRGGLDPTRAAQIRRYEDAMNRQQSELDRVSERSRRLGCQGGGFFSLFTGQTPECAPLNRKMQEMRANIDRMTDEMQRLQSPNADREGQRTVVLDALARNDCGPQYRTAAAHQQRGLFESLFGPGSIVSPGQPAPAQSSTYRTVCVRTCDGFYFPISFSTVPGRFAEDERTCQRLCPAAQAMLFSYPNPGGDINQATSVNGMLYTELPNAFAYRKQFNPACSCKRIDQTWAQALQHLDDTVQQGDIVVTDERANKLSQPPAAKGSQRKPNDAAAKDEPSPARPAIRSTPETGDRKVRAVGPTFIPQQGQ